MRPELSIVFPCYNEAGNLPELIRSLDSLIDGKAIEIILVDNGSKDHSQEIFSKELPLVRNRAQFKLVKILENAGYGNGILTGLRQAEGRILGYSHADLQFDPKSISQAYDLYKNTQDKLSEGGSEFIVKGQRSNRREDERRFSNGLDLIASWIMGGPMVDINGQPKLFSRNLYEKHLINGPKDLTLDVYLMAKALKTGRRVFTLPVYFEKRSSGVSSWNTSYWSKVKTVSRFLKTIVMIRFQSLLWNAER